MSQTNGPAGSPTNVLIFIADDQTHRSIWSLNNPEVHTPNLDRLVARGTAFTYAHHQGAWHGAVCVASRAMLHTGRMLYRCGSDSCGDWPLLGETFAGQGFDTFATGKWHNAGDSLERSFRDFSTVDKGGMYTSTQYDFQKGEPAGDPATSVYLRPAPGNHWAPDDTTAGGHWLRDENAADGVEHTSARWANTTIDYLRGRAEGGGDQPFLAYCAFHAPHDPRQAPTQYLDRYPVDGTPLPPNYLPEHPFNQGDFALRDEQLAPWPRTEHVVRTHRREYYAILTHMDAELGRILDYLDESGLAENTVVVFTADHGLAVGEHGLMGKQNPYDHSVRVPLIFAGPGIARGETRDALVYQHSVYATVAELTGVAAPDTLDFPSLAGVMRDASAVAPHDDIFSSYRHFQRMCRDQTHKLVIYPHLGRWQLFNTAEDPFETDDLALHENAAETHRATIHRLFAALQAWQNRVGDQMRVHLSDYGLG
ncbi:MAG: sulfatase-like hydrolase/transferase [Planctomycetota bacterium]